jgi:hypothetical protein
VNQAYPGYALRNYNLENLPKRQQAALYRKAAEVVERDGWTKGVLHERKNGARIYPTTSGLKGEALLKELQGCCHCAAGSCAMAALEVGLTDEDPGYADKFRNWLAEMQVMTQVGWIQETHYYKEIAKAAIHAEAEGVAACDFIVTINDSILGSELKIDEAEAAKRLAKFFRKVARHLEHGGG